MGEDEEKKQKEEKKEKKKKRGGCFHQLAEIVFLGKKKLFFLPSLYLSSIDGQDVVL